jgi:hypothetical protein
VMDQLSSIDIDTEFDFLIAEAALPFLAGRPLAVSTWSGEGVALVEHGVGQRSRL